MSFQRVVVTTDLSAAADHAIAVAREIAERFEARLTLLHVWEPDNLPDHFASKGHQIRDELRHLAEERLREVASRHGLGPEVDRALVHDASPVEGILDYLEAEAADLLVIASRGRSGLQRLLIGSVTERVVRHAKCAVLAVKPPVGPPSGT